MTSPSPIVRAFASLSVLLVSFPDNFRYQQVQYNIIIIFRCLMRALCPVLMFAKPINIPIDK